VFVCLFHCLLFIYCVFIVATNNTDCTASNGSLLSELDLIQIEIVVAGLRKTTIPGFSWRTEENNVYSEKE